MKPADKPSVTGEKGSCTLRIPTMNRKRCIHKLRRRFLLKPSSKISSHLNCICFRSPFPRISRRWKTDPGAGDPGKPDDGYPTSRNRTCRSLSLVLLPFEKERFEGHSQSVDDSHRRFVQRASRILDDRFLLPGPGDPGVAGAGGVENDPV